MIVLKDVNKDYGKDDNIVHALMDINLTIEKGKLTTIIGKSGSGKSTLMNLIGALDKPTAGEVSFNDENITNFSDDNLAKYRNKKTGFVFQAFYLEPSLSVLDNVCMPLIIAGVDKKVREEKAIELLTKFDIIDKKNKKANELSSGQKQRVAIARALINDPDIILADEPTGNLDSENGYEVMKALKTIALSGKMVVLVTHNIDDAKRFADRIIKLSDGKIVSIEDIV